MVQRVSTVAFEGIEARAVDVQVQIAPGLPAFAIVGLPDKAVSEARERVRSALIASGLALPARRITVNLAPADVPKEGSHYDLPIALGLMAAIGAIPPDALTGFTVLGELGLDGSIAPVAGVLPAAIGANSRDEGLICPAACGAEAAWASPDIQIVAANSLIQIANHFKGTQVLSRPQPKVHERARSTARPARHQGPGERQARAGDRRRRRAPSPDDRFPRRRQVDAGGAAALDPAAAVAGRIARSVDDRLGRRRNRRRRAHRAAAVPRAASFRQHGGADRRRHARKARRNLAGASGRAVSRRVAGVRSAGAGFTAPADGERRGRGIPRQPSRHLSCALHAGRGDEPLPLRPCLQLGYSCKRGRIDRCTADYQARISGPLMDRIDLRIEVPAVTAADLILPPPSEGSAEVAARVAAARDLQLARYAAAGLPGIRTNAEAPASVLETVAQPDANGLKLLRDAAETMRLSARGYHRVLRVARTLADLDGADKIGRLHLAEALSYRALAEDLRRAA